MYSQQRWVKHLVELIVDVIYLHDKTTRNKVLLHVIVLLILMRSSKSKEQRACPQV